MSRPFRVASPVRPPARSLVGTTVLLLVAALCLPASVVAQDDADAGNLLWKWQLLEYRAADGSSQLVPPGIGITALPFAGTVKGEAACSSYEASYSLVKESFRIDTPIIQSRGCDPTAQAIDDAFYQGLADTRTWSTSGSILTLMDEVGDVVMTMTRAELPADPTLARWELARIGTADGAIAPVIAGVQPWVEFLRGGRVVGSTGCGSFVGSYATNDSTMSISGVDSRLTDCTSAVQEQATLILDTFADVTDFDVLPAGLVLEDGNGTTRMALVPAIDLGGRTWTPTAILADDGEVRAEDQQPAQHLRGPLRRDHRRRPQLLPRLRRRQPALRPGAQRVAPRAGSRQRLPQAQRRGRDLEPGRRGCLPACAPEHRLARPPRRRARAHGRRGPARPATRAAVRARRSHLGPPAHGRHTQGSQAAPAGSHR